jgi:hypothetical protein
MLLLVGRDRLRPVGIAEFTAYADMLCEQYITHKDALTRCRQIVADFAVIMTDTIAPVQYHTAVRLRDPDNSVLSLLWTLETVLYLDIKVWRTILWFHNASCGDIGTARKIKDMLVWYRYLTSCREMPLSINSGELSTTDLLIIQRTHEEICRLSKPLADMNSYSSIFNSIVGSPYQHSYFSYEADNKCLNIPSNETGRILHLHNGRRRAIGGDALTGLLQVVWTKTGRLFVDQSLQHLLVAPYVTNAAPFHEEPSFPAGDYALFHKETIVNQMVEYIGVSPSPSPVDAAPEQLLTLDPVHESDHEKCVQQTCCYADDFLLWSFQELLPRAILR